jgi:hypothetical protein
MPKFRENPATFFRNLKRKQRFLVNKKGDQINSREKI